MTKTCVWLLAACVSLMAAHPAALSQDRGVAAAPTLSGSWRVLLHGQHVIPVGMELKHEGNKVTGTLMMWNGEIDLEGEFVDGTMKVSGTLTPTDGAHAGERTVTAALQSDGTLAGTLVTERGSIKLTAERFRERTARAAAGAPATRARSATAFAGKWVLTVVAGANTRTFDLAIVVSDDTITGTLVSDHTGSLDIQQARLTGAALAFSVPMMGSSQVFEFTATMKNARSLTGTIAGPMGAMTLTGERAK